MPRILLALLALSIAAPAPATDKPVEQDYILRLEERGRSDIPITADQPLEAPVLADQEPLIYQIDLQVTVGRDFQLKLQQAPLTRELSGNLNPEDGRYRLKVAYRSGTEIQKPGEKFTRKSISSAETLVSMELGKQIAIGGMRSSSTRTLPSGEVVNLGESKVFVVTLLTREQAAKEQSPKPD